MKAAVLHQVGAPFQIEEVELLPPEPGEVRVRMGGALSSYDARVPVPFKVSKRELNFETSEFLESGFLAF